MANRNELKKKAYTPKTNQYLTPFNELVPREIYIKEEIKWQVSCFINALNSNYILCDRLKTKAIMNNIQIIKIVTLNSHISLGFPLV